MTVAQMSDYIDTHIDFYIHRRLKSTLGDSYTTIAEHRQALSAEQRDKVPPITLLAVPPQGTEDS